MSKQKIPHIFRNVTFRGQTLRITQIEGEIWFLATDVRELTGGPQRQVNKLYGLMHAKLVRNVNPENCGPGSNRKALSTTGAEIVLKRGFYKYTDEFLDWVKSIDFSSEPAPSADHDYMTDLRLIVQRFNTVQSELNSMLISVERLSKCPA